MLRTCNLEIPPLEKRSQIIGEGHLNWATISLLGVYPNTNGETSSTLISEFFNLQFLTLVHRILIENFQLLLCSYIFGYLQKGNTYEIHNLKNQNLPTIASHIFSFPNAAFWPSFLVYLGLNTAIQLILLILGLLFVMIQYTIH